MRARMPLTAIFHALRSAPAIRACQQRTQAKLPCGFAALHVCASGFGVIRCGGTSYRVVGRFSRIIAVPIRDGLVHIECVGLFARENRSIRVEDKPGSPPWFVPVRSFSARWFHPARLSAHARFVGKARVEPQTLLNRLEPERTTFCRTPTIRGRFAITPNQKLLRPPHSSETETN